MEQFWSKITTKFDALKSAPKSNHGTVMEKEGTKTPRAQNSIRPTDSPLSFSLSLSLSFSA
jgi:hypothetical protein